MKSAVYSGGSWGQQRFGYIRKNRVQYKTVKSIIFPFI